MTRDNLLSVFTRFRLKASLLKGLEEIILKIVSHCNFLNHDLLLFIRTNILLGFSGNRQVVIQIRN
jgi:hypothetical protein